MADQEQLAILRSGARAWSEWRSEDPDARPDLSNVDLSNADLSNADLSNAHLGYANLEHADLRFTSLEHANLSFANLENADLRTAGLRGANLSHARGLSRSQLQTTRGDTTTTKLPENVKPPTS